MNITPHDFTKPIRLAPQWQQRLTGWFQAAVALANRTWVKQLPTALEASMVTLEPVYAGQALSGLPQNTLVYRVMLAGENVPTLLALPRALALNVIGAMLGDKEAVQDRELTLVEENLAEYFLVHLWLPFFREAWPAARRVSWELQEREANAQTSRTFAATDTLLALHLQMSGPWGKADSQWFFGKKGLLESLADDGGAGSDKIDEKAVTVRKEALVASLPLDLQIVLGTTEVTLSQLSSLHVGDVLLLDQRSDEPAVARAGTHTLFQGKAGRVGAWKAFRIESLSEK